jgi:hypothetical protein
MSILSRLFGSKGRRQGTIKDTRSSPTMKDLLIAQTPPWNRVAPIVINVVLETITDKGLLEAFVIRSMDANLVTRYEALGWEESDSTVIRAQISQILCEAGNRAVPMLAEALAENRKEAALEALKLAGDTFEAAAILAKNQIAAYTGLATIYALLGRRTESLKWARRGLDELEELRRDGAAQAFFQHSTLFPANILDQAEQQLRTFIDD